MSMSGSNTGALRPYTARQMLEEALTRAGVPSVKFTPEIVFKSMDQFNLILTEFPNRGIQLWKRTTKILPCYVNNSEAQLPPGVNTVLQLNRRSLFRQIGTPFASSGVAANAFDDDFATTCVNVGADGDIGCTFETATWVSTIGILFGGTGAVGLFYEYTLNGTDWLVVDAADVLMAPGQWYWRDINGVPAALGWRVRAVGTPALEITELFFGNTPMEITLGAWNMDEWFQMVNKAQGGQVLNWYQQRDLSAPVLFLWPVPDWSARYDQLTVVTHDLLDDLTDVNQTVDVPRRWYEALTAMLARRLCRSLPEADMSRYAMLRGEEAEGLSLAQGEERDGTGNFNINPGIYPYTR